MNKDEQLMKSICAFTGHRPRRRRRIRIQKDDIAWAALILFTVWAWWVTLGYAL